MRDAVPPSLHCHPLTDIAFYSFFLCQNAIHYTSIRFDSYDAILGVLVFFVLFYLSTFVMDATCESGWSPFGVLCGTVPLWTFISVLEHMLNDTVCLFYLKYLLEIHLYPLCPYAIFVHFSIVHIHVPSAGSIAPIHRQSFAVPQYHIVRGVTESVSTVFFVLLVRWCPQCLLFYTEHWTRYTLHLHTERARLSFIVSLSLLPSLLLICLLILHTVWCAHSLCLPGYMMHDGYSGWNRWVRRLYASVCSSSGYLLSSPPSVQWTLLNMYFRWNLNLYSVSSPFPFLFEFVFYKTAVLSLLFVVGLTGNVPLLRPPWSPFFLC